ncbi:MAG: hypothetical protein HQL63_05530 [Magnetococcales bacterium]|nr:hypothetical protein [Magnetococcales bacterium]
MTVSFNSYSSLLSSKYLSYGVAHFPASSGTVSPPSATSGSSSSVDFGNTLTSATQAYASAMSSAGEGVVRIHTAQVGLEQISANMVKLKNLATIANSATISQGYRDKLQADAAEIQKENRLIIARSQHGPEKLLSSKHTTTVQSGVGAFDTTEISFKDYSKSFVEVDLSTQSGASAAMKTLDANVAEATQGITELGKTRMELEKSLDSMGKAAKALLDVQSTLKGQSGQSSRSKGTASGSQGASNAKLGMSFMA